jgi:hypothetical protein
MLIKFITCIYSDLSGTEYGGRAARGNHYRYSLLSLLKMTNADFVCYTSERELEGLQTFFYEKNGISADKLKLVVFDLKQNKFQKYLDLYKDYESAKKGDRCLEIQWSKFFWWWNEDKSYDYYFWIDAGLSHCGLIPLKYLTSEDIYAKYYESSLFNNLFLENLIKDCGDKFLILGKDNDRNYWSGTVDPKWYTDYQRKIHIIGGLFGGKKELWDNMVTMFENYLEKILTTDEKTYHEEVIMTLMYYNHQELFERKHFDIWWCSDNCPPGTDPRLFQENKSFFRILEEFNRIYE